MTNQTLLHPIAVDAVIRERRSSRAFLSKPVPSQVVNDILSLASRAPSGTNMRPWRVYVLDRAYIDAVTTSIAASGVQPSKAVWDDYRYYPEVFSEPYSARRRQVGADLYRLLGIERRDVDKMRSHFERNFSFFGAPVGLLVTIDRKLEKGSWLDLGMFMQTILLAAQARGLGTCVQAAFAPYHRQIRPVVGMPDEEVLVCGIALGHTNKTSPENSLKTDRAPLGDWMVDLRAAETGNNLREAA